VKAPIARNCRPWLERLIVAADARSAIADRLVHKGLLVRIKGKSRRSEQNLDDNDAA